MIDARSREECERYGGEWVDGYIKIGNGRRENVYVDAYCRKPRKGSHHYEKRMEPMLTDTARGDKHGKSQ